MTVEGTAGGGAVTATVTGHGDIKSVTISKDVVDPDDVEMLQDLVTAAVNDATQPRQAADRRRRWARVTGGLQHPGCALGRDRAH